MSSEKKLKLREILGKHSSLDIIVPYENIRIQLLEYLSDLENSSFLNSISSTKKSELHTTEKVCSNKKINILNIEIKTLENYIREQTGLEFGTENQLIILMLKANRKYIRGFSLDQSLYLAKKLIHSYNDILLKNSKLWNNNIPIAKSAASTRLEEELIKKAKIFEDPNQFVLEASPLEYFKVFKEKKPNYHYLKDNLSELFKNFIRELVKQKLCFLGLGVYELTKKLSKKKYKFPNPLLLYGFEKTNSEIDLLINNIKNNRDLFTENIIYDIPYDTEDSIEIGPDRVNKFHYRKPDIIQATKSVSREIPDSSEKKSYQDEENSKIEIKAYTSLYEEISNAKKSIASIISEDPDKKIIISIPEDERYRALSRLIYTASMEHDVLLGKAGDMEVLNSKIWKFIEKIISIKLYLGEKDIKINSSNRSILKNLISVSRNNHKSPSRKKIKAEGYIQILTAYNELHKSAYIEGSLDKQILIKLKNILLEDEKNLVTLIQKALKIILSNDIDEYEKNIANYIDKNLKFLSRSNPSGSNNDEYIDSDIFDIDISKESLRTIRALLKMEYLAENNIIEETKSSVLVLRHDENQIIEADCVYILGLNKQRPQKASLSNINEILRGEKTNFTEKILNKIKQSKTTYISYLEEKGQNTSEAHSIVENIRYKLSIKNQVSSKSSLRSFSTQDPISINKQTAIIKNITDYLTNKSIYPSAINTYLDCSLKFFFKYINGYRDNITVNKNAIFGSIFHDIMERIYEGQAIIDHKKIASLKSKITDITDKTIDSYYDQIPIPKKILSQILAKLANQVLEIDRKNAPFEIIGLELGKQNDLNREYEYKDLQIRISGIIDRVDKKDAKVRIIDYKTGKYISRVKELEELYDTKGKTRNSIFLQMLIYSWIYSKYESNTPYIMGTSDLFSQNDMKHLTLDNQQILVDNNFQNKISEILGRIIADILNQDNPITQVDNLNICRNCEYKNICKRSL